MIHSDSSLIKRGVAEVIEANHLQAKLTAGQPLRVKLGIDPSKPDLHIGHALTLRKLRQFQEAGHTAVLIIGDYTAQIGDPTDRNTARNTLSEAEVKVNAEGYLDQAFKILERDRTEVHWNSEWFATFNLRDVIELMAKTTLNHLLSHETFAKRLHDNQPLYSHEMLYPMLQGYDSVMVKSDLEIGGIDQKFNVLMGRDLQRAHNMPEQDVLLLHYLPGTDGSAKMSKTLGNTINLTDSPDDMFGKVMSIPDTLIIPYFELATNSEADDVASMKENLKKGAANPRDLKFDLATTIVSEFHSPEAALAAGEAFNRIFRDRQLPEDIETLVLPAKTYDILDILVNRTTLAASKSEARRLILQKGVKVNDAVIDSFDATISPEVGEEVIIHVGPRRVVKVVWK